MLQGANSSGQQHVLMACSYSSQHQHGIGHAALARFARTSGPRDSSAVMGSSETTELVTAYYSIDNPRKRRAVHDLIASLSKAEWE